jgi:hypothetical protein
MMTFIPNRLRMPLVYGIATLLFAGAWLIHGGRLWWVSILALVAGIVRVAVLYLGGGTDTDAGALAGGRADERLKLISARSWALAGRVSIIASFLGLTAGIAVWAAWWWPFALMLVLSIFGYLFGLSNNGFAEEEPGDNAHAGRTVTSPASR